MRSLSAFFSSSSHRLPSMGCSMCAKISRHNDLSKLSFFLASFAEDQEGRIPRAKFEQRVKDACGEMPISGQRPHAAMEPHSAAACASRPPLLPSVARERALKRSMHYMIDDVEETAEEMARLQMAIAELEDRIDALRGWDKTDVDNRRMQEEALQKKGEVLTLRKQAEKQMISILQKVIAIEENMEVRGKDRAIL